MPTVLLVGLVAVMLWSLVSHRFERWGVAGPAGLLVLGAFTVVWNTEPFGTAIDSPVTEKIVEIVLAILLFVDATEVRGGVFGNEGRITLRLVLIGLPVSLVLAAVAGGLLIPQTLPFLMILIACVVMPTDFAPAAQILRLGHVAPRVRQILNVESGYNDGLVSPLFAVTLPVAVAWSELMSGKDVDATELAKREDEIRTAVLNALPATGWALVIGVVLGLGLGALVRVAHRRTLMVDAGARVVMLLVPLAAYGLATLPVLGANGFVAAFVAGIAYRIARTRGQEVRQIAHGELLLVEEIGVLTSNFIWFVLGGAAAIVFSSKIGWEPIVLALLALTVLRIAPVYLSLLGSSVRPRERLLVGALGPRGTASIVFGLLAYNALPEESTDAALVLTVTVVTVTGSILLHGIAAPLLLRRMPLAAPDEASSQAPPRA